MESEPDPALQRDNNFLLSAHNQRGKKNKKDFYQKVMPYFKIRWLMKCKFSYEGLLNQKQKLVNHEELKVDLGNYLCHKMLVEGMRDGPGKSYKPNWRKLYCSISKLPPVTKITAQSSYFEIMKPQYCSNCGSEEFTCSC